MRGLQAQQSIGEMDQLVAFLSTEYTPDGFGGSAVSFTTAIPQPHYRAHVEEISAKEESTNTPQDKVTKLIRITMRSLGASNPTQHTQVSWNAKTYDIIDIILTQRQRFMIIQARLFDNTI